MIMPPEPRLFGGHMDIPPEAYEHKTLKRWKHAKDQGEALGALFLVALIVLAAIWLASCQRRDHLVTVKTSDGKVLQVTPEEARSMYAAGADVPWDFTKIKDPKEPGEIFPDSALPARPTKK